MNFDRLIRRFSAVGIFRALSGCCVVEIASFFSSLVYIGYFLFFDRIGEHRPMGHGYYIETIIMEPNGRWFRSLAARKAWLLLV